MSGTTVDDAAAGVVGDDGVEEEEKNLSVADRIVAGRESIFITKEWNWRMSLLLGSFWNHVATELWMDRFVR